jgi:hypothetical protein
MLDRYSDIIASMIPRQFQLPTHLQPARPANLHLLEYCRLVTGERIEIRDAFDGAPWSSLIFHVAGELLDRPAWVERSRKAFFDFISKQQPGGAFFSADVHANPETRWYEELITLHALASYAARVQDPSMDNAVARNAEFHLNETQPDHATAEPWGLLAFIRYAPPLADQVLHAMSMQYPQGISGVPLLLMTDVLYGLQRYTTGVAASAATGGR